MPEGFLLDRGLTNYWGYNTIGYFAPHQAYAGAGAGGDADQVTEFKDMVKALHRADIEVILDVVYNHTAEGNENGPTLSFRGLDNPAYYRLVAGDERHYYDTTGTGNSLNAGNPVTLRLIMDSLRYWLSEMHVDGFRFDLAATLGREEDNAFDQYSAFFDLVACTAGPAAAPPRRSTWSPCTTASRCATWCPTTASTTKRTARATVTGSNDNRSWNCGAEGPVDDPGINALRARQERAMLGTLLLSFGLPMLLGGDELGRTQQGNNNAYCQDNEISWFDWASADSGLRDYVKRLIELRRGHPVFRRQEYLSGAEAAELGWYSCAGTLVTQDQWADPTMHAVGVYLDGADAPDEAADGTPMVDDDFLVLVNARWEPVEFTVPEVRSAPQDWLTELDSYDLAVPAGSEQPRRAGDRVQVRPRSLLVLRSRAAGAATSVRQNRA